MFLSDPLSTLFTFQGKIFDKPQSVRTHGHRGHKPAQHRRHTYCNQDFLFMTNGVKAVSLLVLTHLIPADTSGWRLSERSDHELCLTSWTSSTSLACRDQLPGGDRRVRRASLSERRHLPGPRGCVLLPVCGRLPGPRLRAQHRRMCQRAVSERGQVHRQGQQVGHSSDLRSPVEAPCGRLLS